MLHANDQMLLTQRPELSFQRSLPPPLRRRRSRCNSFAEPIIACMVEERRPSQREIAAVAALIWRDCRRSDGPLWHDIEPGSRLYKSMIAAARAALGLLSLGQSPSPALSSEPAVWWKPADSSS